MNESINACSGRQTIQVPGAIAQWLSRCAGEPMEATTLGSTVGRDKMKGPFFSKMTLVHTRYCLFHSFFCPFFSFLVLTWNIVTSINFALHTIRHKQRN